jgi:copper chaperone CopZ
MSIQTFTVDGMTCDHCVHAVRSEIATLAPQAAVEVVLGTPSIVTVTGTDLTDEQIAAALDEAGGYTLVSASRE